MKRITWILAVRNFFFSVSHRRRNPNLRWLGHAAFVFTSRTGNIFLIDPWMTNPKAPKNITFTHIEGILVTHGHSDHVGEAFELAKKYNAPLVASYELTEIAKKHGVTNVLPINPGGSQTDRQMSRSRP